MRDQSTKNGAPQDDSDISGFGEKRVLSPTSCPPPPIGRKSIGRYEIIYPIAQGGMAGVYAGRLTGIAGFQRLVAVKVVHSHLSSQESFVRMFLDEARLAAGIHHPNVGEVIEVGQDNGLYYMVCELILGQSLRSFHRRAAREKVAVSPVFYARIASATALGLKAAHNLCGPDGKPINLVHRDVSPRNILLTYDGYVKLIDFGVAYAQDRMSHTDAGTLKGKIGYMSPEQIKCRPLDGRSDIFSLGVVLYQMVTGRQPFFGETDFERFNRILEYRFDKPRKIVREIHPQLERIILKAMARDPEDRYPTADAMSADLEAFIKGSRESVDNNDLSSLMHSLFSDEQEYHLQKMKELGTKIAPREQSDIVAKPLDLRVTIPSLPRHRSAPDAPSVEGNLAKPSFRSKKTAVVTGSLAIVLLLLIFIIALPKVTEESREKENRVDNVVHHDETPRAVVTPAKSDSDNLREDDNDSSSVSEAAITLAISPAQAEIKLDGIAVPSDTKLLHLPADDRNHQLQVSAQGYTDHNEIIRADADKTVIISLISKPNKSTVKKHEKPKKKTIKTKQKSSSSSKAGKPTTKKASLFEGNPYHK